jgi:hypothetical protein
LTITLVTIQILWDIWDDQLFVSRLIRINALDGSQSHGLYVQGNCTTRKQRALVGSSTFAELHSTTLTVPRPTAWENMPEGRSPMGDACKKVEDIISGGELR